MIIKKKLLIIILFLMFIIYTNLFNSSQKQRNYFKENQNNISLKYNNIINNVNKNYKKIKIENDVLSLIINTNGGIIEEAKLLKYKKELNSTELFKLLETNNKFIYQIKNGLIKKQYLFNNLNKIINPKFKVEKKNNIIINNKNYIFVPMCYKDNNNNILIKTFILKRNCYEIKIIDTFINNNIIPIKLSYFGQINQSIDLPKYIIKKNLKDIAYSIDSEKYKQITLKDNIKLNLNYKFGWIAMLQKYFVTSIMPISKINNILYNEKINNNVYIIGFQSNFINIKPFEIKNYKTALWIGPKLQNNMEILSPYLSKTINYGFLYFISKPLFKILILIHNIINNWGFSIILITFFLRIIMLPISKFQYIYLKKIKILNPKIKKIKKKYKHNLEILNKKILKLYKIKKINPLLGLIPLLIQMPIFLSLYNILIESVELRHSKFLFWINDLSSKDPYFILPILLSITMYYVQKTSNMITNNSINKNIINYIPIIFSILFFWFPSGLIIYYIINNIFIIIQQKIYLK
ncbi:MAG: membrane protein insertase YidC [Enterobacteriaceae bacterium PSpyr]|nr:MAG: membrane protein insertase YidC [Enterobacteriaceae bacterium PSpyr]